jgi:hypothetical protein
MLAAERAMSSHELVVLPATSTPLVCTACYIAPLALYLSQQKCKGMHNLVIQAM